MATSTPSFSTDQVAAFVEVARLGSLSEDLTEARTRQRAVQGINAHVLGGEDPLVVARTIGDAIEAARPRLRYTSGKGTGVLAKLRGMMPESLFDRSLRREFQLDA